MGTPEQFADAEGMRILITGGLGFIGSNLAHRLVKGGAEIAILDAKIPHLGANMANVEGISDDVEIIIGDIRDAEIVRSAIKDKDIIFSLAAQKSHPMSMKDPFLDIDINCNGIITILEEVRKTGNKTRIIFPTTTTAVEYPIDVYSANKIVGEKYHYLYHKNYGLPVTCLRFPNIYGPRALINSPNGGVVNFFIGLALQDKPLTVYGEGDEVKNLIYVDDVVSALIKASLSNKTIGKPPFVVSSDEHFDIKQMAELIVEEVGKGKVVHVDYPKNLAKLRDADTDNTRAKIFLDWKPETAFKEGLAKTVDYYRGRLDKYL